MQPHDVAVVAAADRDLAEVLGALVAAGNADRELAVRRLDAAGRQLDVLGAERALDVARSDAGGREAVPPQPDPHRVAAAAREANAGHSRHRRELVDEVTLGVVGQFESVADRAREVQPVDDVAVRVDLDDLGRIDLVRQLLEYAGHAVADVVGGGVDVAADDELDRHLRAAVGRLGRDLVDALDTADRVLDDLRDAGLDDAGRRAQIVGLDADDRGVDVGELAHAEARQADDAEHDDDEVEDGREDRTADREIGEDHGVRSPRCVRRRR